MPGATRAADLVVQECVTSFFIFVSTPGTDWMNGCPAQWLHFRGGLFGDLSHGTFALLPPLMRDLRNVAMTLLLRAVRDTHDGGQAQGAGGTPTS